MLLHYYLFNNCFFADKTTVATILQTACCNAIRNVVSRSSDLRGDFVNQDVESLLQGVRSRHPGECDDAAKAALRDLGLKVELKEEWTGGLVKQ